MSKIELELPGDMETWLRNCAVEYGFTLAEMLEHLVILESGLRDADPLGRRVRFRDTSYRQLTPPGHSLPFSGAPAFSGAPQRLIEGR